MRYIRSRLAILWLASYGAISAIAADAWSLRVESRLVRVPVTVTDRSGAPVMDLQAKDFHVFDGNERRTIVAFTREDAPASVAIVLDVSGSMQNKLGHAAAAVRELAAALEPEDEASLTAFAEKPIRLAEFTRDPESMAGKVFGLQARGPTALVDAVYAAMNHFRSASESRRAVVVISDGGDNHSRYSEKELTRLAMESDVQIYSISILESLLSQEQREGAFLLKKLSEVTGGLHLTIRHRGELPQAAEKVARAVKSLYVIAYQPQGDSKPGKWRKIRVIVDEQLRGNVRVSAKSGYYEP